MGLDVSRVARYFFRTIKMLRQHNKTYIVLIPKHSTPTNFNDYRPISLYSTFYKILSKIMVNIIKTILDKLINVNQKGFVLGRQILDASISTHEIIHSMDKSKHADLTLKLDISKAYDNVKWSILYKILSFLAF